MSLPKGFGRDADGGSCNACLNRLVYSRLDRNYFCTNPDCELGRDKRTNEIKIPITKWVLAKIVFFVAHYGGILMMLGGVLIGGYTGLVIGIIGLFGVFIVTLIVAMNYDYNDHDWSKRKQLFFAYVPIANFIKRFRFGTE